jgi:hypothetical protein
MGYQDYFGGIDTFNIYNKNMPKFLIVAFCKFYGFLKESFNAMGFVTILLSLNVFTIIGYYKTIVMHSDQIMIPTIYELLIVVSIGIYNYAYFLSGKKYEAMYEEFQRDKSMGGNGGTRSTALYIIITLVMLISLIWLGRMNIKPQMGV